MLSHKELNIINRIIYLTVQMYICPFEWVDTSTGKFGPIIPTKSTRRKFLTFCNLMLSASYSTFLIFRLIPGWAYNYDNLEVAKSLNFHLMILCIHSALSIAQITSFVYTEEICTWYNQTLYLNKLAMSLNNGSKETRMEEIRAKCFVLFYYYLFWILRSFLSSVFIFMYNENYYIYSMMPENIKGIWTIMIFTILEVFFIHKGIIFHHAVIVLVYLNVFTNAFWLKFCNNLVNESKWKWVIGNGVQAHPIQRIFFILRKLQCLMNTWNKAMDKFLGGLQVILFADGIIGLYGTIRLFSKLSLPLYIADMVVAGAIIFEEFICISQMSNTFENSNLLKIAILKTKPNKYNRCCERAIRPLQFKLGFFRVKRSTKLTILEIVLSSATFVLITFR